MTRLAPDRDKPKMSEFGIQCWPAGQLIKIRT